MRNLIMFSLGFQKQLTVGFTAIALASLLTCSFVSFTIVSHIIQSMTLSGLEKEITNVQSSIEVSAKDNEGKLSRAMDYWSPVVEKRFKATKSESYESFLEQLSAEMDGVATIFAKTDAGFVRVATTLKDASGKKAVGTLLAADSPQAKSLGLGTRYVGRSDLFGVSYYVAYDPIRVDGRIVGAFFLGTPDRAVTEIRNYLKRQKLLTTGYFYILDSKGKFVLHPNKEGQNVLGATDLDGRKIFQEIIEKKNGYIEYRWLNQEVNSPQWKIALFHYFPELDWYVAASLNDAEVQAPCIRLRNILFLVTSALVVGATVLTILFGQKVTRRLNSVSEMLARSSNRVAAKAEVLGQSSKTLAEATLQQAAGVQQTVASVEQIRAMIGKTSDATHNVEGLSRSMSEEAGLGQKILEELGRAVQQIAASNVEVGQQMDVSHREIESISAVIASIEEKTRVINDIVFQTKLLSFNASIEAARAGDHGRGFAVVAEEVGRLATLSGHAATDIKDNLEQSRTKVDAIVAEAKSKMSALAIAAKGDIDRGLEVGTKCKAVFEGLIKEISEANQAIQHISAASKEQAQGVTEINKAASEFDRVTRQNSSIADEVKTSARELNENSETLADAVADLYQFLTGEIRSSTETPSQRQPWKRVA